METRHVFLEGAQIRAMLSIRPVLHVLEVGFGTGLRFLLTAAESLAAGTPLMYTGLEKDLPAAEHLVSLGFNSIDGANDAAVAWVRWRQELPQVVPHGHYERALLPGCMLTLVVGDATQTVLPCHQYDAVYLDGFSPRTNPELWTASFLQKLYDATAPAGILATYSAAGHVRRALTDAGYQVERRAGPPGKREVLAAKKPSV